MIIVIINIIINIIVENYIRYITSRPSCEGLRPRGLASFKRHQLLFLSWAELLENRGVGLEEFPPGRVDAMLHDSAAAISVFLQLESNHLQLE